ncbi:MAG: hypothetical protein IKL96_02590 [Kiritimatiellae bacterium]|nr:hypothetical protein [Kiritimatiellia bacterium]
MTTSEVKTALGKAARRCWPNVTRASDLPFPEYWKGATEWLTFHAPHVGDALMRKLIDGFAVSAKEAEERGEAPVPPKVPEKVKEIWAIVAEHSSAIRADEAKTEEKRAAWEHAAERAAEVRSRFAPRANAVQGRLL